MSAFTEELRGWAETFGMSNDTRRKHWLMRKAADLIEEMSSAMALIDDDMDAGGCVLNSTGLFYQEDLDQFRAVLAKARGDL